MALLICRSFYIKTTLPILASSRSLRSKAQGGSRYSDKNEYFSTLLTNAANINFLRTEYSFRHFFDRTFKKYNENFKVVSVEGNIGIGKGLLTQRLADAFGMNYNKDCTEEDIFKTNEYGFEFDFRSLNDVLPDNIQLYDLDALWNDRDPIRKGRPLALQRSIYANRYYNYAKSMCLLWNTGTGFFTDRSPHSDWTFARAMRDCGLMSHDAYDWYELNYVNTVCEVFRPHLIIYLKTPISYVQQQIKENNILGKDSLNLTTRFLEILDENIHEHVQNMKKYSEVFEIDIHNLDWKDSFEVDHIVSEISHIDLEGKQFSDLHPKFRQWRMSICSRDSFDNHRKTFSAADHIFTNMFKLVPMPDTLREGCFDRYERLIVQDVVKRHPVLAYQPPFHPARFSFPKSLLGLEKSPKNFEVDRPKVYLNIN